MSNGRRVWARHEHWNSVDMMRMLKGVRMSGKNWHYIECQIAHVGKTGGRVCGNHVTSDEYRYVARHYELDKGERERARGHIPGAKRRRRDRYPRMRVEEPRIEVPPQPPKIQIPRSQPNPRQEERRDMPVAQPVPVSAKVEVSNFIDRRSTADIAVQERRIATELAKVENVRCGVWVRSASVERAVMQPTTKKQKEEKATETPASVPPTPMDVVVAAESSAPKFDELRVVSEASSHGATPLK